MRKPASPKPGRIDRPQVRATHEMLAAATRLLGPAPGRRGGSGRLKDGTETHQAGGKLRRWWGAIRAGVDRPGSRG